jgi:hypothetical protein
MYAMFAIGSCTSFGVRSARHGDISGGQKTPSNWHALAAGHLCNRSVIFVKAAETPRRSANVLRKIRRRRQSKHVAVSAGNHAPRTEAGPRRCPIVPTNADIPSAMALLLMAKLAKRNALAREHAMGTSHDGINRTSGIAIGAETSHNLLRRHHQRERKKHLRWKRDRWRQEIAM